MIRTIVAALLLVLVTPAASLAHRLDEYLQAARVSLERDRITVDIDLTAGVRIASGIVALIDHDHDGVISPAEARSYAQLVLSEIAMRLDGQQVTLMLDRVEVPSVAEMPDGMGVIQLTAHAGLDGLATGHRELYFENNHHRDSSVYLVNALVPKDRSIGVIRQVRDSRQQTVQIEYSVASRRLAQWFWSIVAGGGLLALLRLRRRGADDRRIRSAAADEVNRACFRA
jgi:hypothetical protein